MAKTLTPLDLIKNGIQNGNWDNVCDGYELLTGESLNPPQIKNSLFTKEEKSNIIKALFGQDISEYNKDSNDLIVTPKIIKKYKTKKEAVKKLGRPKKIKNIPNNSNLNWVDDRTEAIDDIEIDRKLTKNQKPTERRPPIQMVKVQCDKCNRENEVPSGLAPKKDGDINSRYLCDKCTKKLGE